LEQTIPKLKVKMQSVADDDDRKRLLEKPRFELAAEDRPICSVAYRPIINILYMQ